jgi:hypothetical protein
MSESVHEQVIEKLQACKGNWTEVAEGSGVPRRTIEKVARREIPNPGVQTIDKLLKYFRERDVGAAVTATTH